MNIYLQALIEGGKVVGIACGFVVLVIAVVFGLVSLFDRSEVGAIVVSVLVLILLLLMLSIGVGMDIVSP